jgi:GxxExxY protein
LLGGDEAEGAEEAEDAEAKSAAMTHANERLPINQITYRVIKAAMVVHSAIGPGSLEKVYDACLHGELERAGLQFEHQVKFSVAYQGLQIASAFRVDYLVENRVLVELKAVEKLHPLHRSQLLSYLKISHKTVGLLLNFNVLHLRDGIHRVVNGYEPEEG